jgi:hypothetical protein
MADDNSSLAAVESLLGDRYVREARLAPAFLCIFPIFLLLIGWIGDIQHVLPGLLTLLATFGVVRWISHIARSIGDELEVGLFENWDGKPTTTLLRCKPRDSVCGAEEEIQRFLLGTGQREIINALYSSHYAKGLPTEADEKKANADPYDSLDRLYEPAVTWLRENTRDNELVFEENISYGFQRNFYALKSFAVSAAVVSLVIEAGAMAVSHHYHLPHPAWSLLIAVGLAIAAFLVGVLCFVSEESVKLQGFVYARQLLNSIYVDPEKTKAHSAADAKG